MDTQEEVQKGMFFVYSMAFTFAMTGNAPTAMHKETLEEIGNVIYIQPRHEHHALVLDIMLKALPDASGEEYKDQTVEALLKGFYEAQHFERKS